MSLSFRGMVLEDIPAIHKIDTLSFSLPWPERSFHHEIMDNPVARGWVAQLNGQIVAMLVLWLIEDEVHIATIATHPIYRRRGIGEKLLIHALISARDEGAKRAFLEVRAGNVSAQSLYNKYGFIVDGIRPRYYKDNNEDAILMSLEDIRNINQDLILLGLSDEIQGEV